MQDDNTEIPNNNSIATQKYLLYASFLSFNLAEQMYRLLSKQYPDQSVFIRHTKIDAQPIYQVLIGPVTSEEQKSELLNKQPKWMPYQPKEIELPTKHY
ncbi:hypothetical protein L3V86_00815 [Thiotrichales bacterium 19S11-10]|nr:hypothetical protein [Thiotrichales bacterium 19S11-10]